MAALVVAVVVLLMIMMFMVWVLVVAVVMVLIDNGGAAKAWWYRFSRPILPLQTKGDKCGTANLLCSSPCFLPVTDTYAQLRGKRGEVCDTVSLVFTIDPRITGPPSTATCT